MENKYPWYKTAGNAWKVHTLYAVDIICLFPSFSTQQSVRHHLSLNLLFEREPRPVTDPGVGSYWTVNLDAPPGTKRPRKRGRKDANDDSDPAPPPRKRGRPRKYPEQEPMVFDQPPMTMMLVPTTDAYPPGCQLPTWSARGGSSTKTSAGEPSTYGDDDELAYSDMPTEDHRASDGDYADSEEEDHRDRSPPYLLRPVSSLSDSGRDPRTARNYNEPPHNSPSRSTGQQTQQPHHHHTRRLSTSSNGTSGYIDYDTRDNSDHRSAIERLQREVQSLRQQSADAVSVSVKMSDQLAEAHAEASRVRAALRSMENRYEESERRRKEAERIADQQQRLRQIAEASLQDRRRH